MANKMRRVLAILLALSLCAGYIMIPAAAEETETPSVQVEVSLAPDDSGSMNVNVDGAHISSADAGEGIVEDTFSSTTSWDGINENGASVSGSETTTVVTGSDSKTGDALYENGTVTGSETTIKTETTINSSEEENVLISEETRPIHTEEDGEATTETTVSSTTESEEGQWIEGRLQEGTAQLDEELSGKTETSTSVEIGAEAPGNVTITLDPNDRKGTTVTKNVSVEDVIAGLITLPADGSYEELKDENGVVIGYQITTFVEDSETNVTVNNPTQTSATRTEAAEVTLPEGIRAGTENVYAEDGTTVIGQIVTEVVPTYDENGKVIKYVITKTTTVDTDKTEISESDAASTREDETKSKIILPEKPLMSVATDPVTGISTSVSVEEILDADNNVIGYAVTTVKTNIDGTRISSVTEKQYGTVITTQTTTVTDPTTVETVTQSQEVTTEVTEITAQKEITETTTVTTRLNEFINTNMTQTDYAYVEIEGKLYFVYTGSMTVTEGNGHGDLRDVLPVTPDTSLFNKNTGKDLDAGGGDYDEEYNSNKDPNGDDFKLVGNGISSNLLVKTNDSYTSVSQFRLENADGTTYYDLCIDLDTSAQAGFFYDLVDVSSQGYFQNATGTTREAAEKIRSIVLNGYWGTKTGIGSMADVKALLTDYLKGEGKSDSEIRQIVDSLTEGQALTATQTALWKFGSKDKNTVVNENDLVTGYADTIEWVWKNGGWKVDYDEVNHNSADYINTEYLYRALLAAAQNPTTESDEGVEFLDAEDITGGAITVKNKVESNSKNNDSNRDNDVYNTDLTFSLGIEPSKLNGDLIVTVNVGGEEVRKVRLAGADDPLLPLGRIIKNDDGSYTIPDVELTEGVYVTLNLSGTQALGTGVYVYQSEKIGNLTSQTLVGLATGDRKVNLNMNMQFSVEEPDAKATKVEGTETEAYKTVSNRVDTKTDVSTTTKTTVSTTTETDSETSGTITTRVYADLSVTEVITEETVSQRSWANSWKKTFERKPHYSDDEHEDPGNEQEELEIPDEEVPLADVPFTGDLSLIWILLSGLSAAGMLLLARKKEA